MINEIILYRRQGMSFGKIAEKLNSTVGKVHYQWIKNGMDQQVKQVDAASNNDVVDEVENTKNTSNNSSYLNAKLIGDNKLVSSWKLASWQNHLLTSYFHKEINFNILIFRLYDVTDIYFNGSNAHNFYEFQLPDSSTHWTIKGLKQGRSYLTEIGYKINSEQFFPVLRSNAVHNTFDEIEPPNPLYQQWVAEAPQWKGQVSTYSYYENTNGENDENGSI